MSQDIGFDYCALRHMSNIKRSRRDKALQHLIDRDGPWCFYCKRAFTSDLQRQLTIDHYVPKCEGGTNVRENLRMCCFYCNQLKGDMHGDAFMAILNAC